MNDDGVNELALATLNLSKQVLVQNIMRALLSETKEETPEVKYLAYECLMSDKFAGSGKVLFRQNSGWTNPNKHALHCVSNGGVVHLNKYFESVRNELNRKSMSRSYSAPSANIAGPSSRERAMYDDLRLIIYDNVPLCVFERESMRGISKHEHTFSSNGSILSCAK